MYTICHIVDLRLHAQAVLTEACSTVAYRQFRFGMGKRKSPLIPGYLATSEQTCAMHTDKSEGFYAPHEQPPRTQSRAWHLSRSIKHWRCPSK